MKPFYIVLRLAFLILILAGAAHAHTIQSQKSGFWNQDATWLGDAVPEGHDVLIQHEVVVGPGSKAPTGQVTIAAGGSLTFADESSEITIKNGSLVIAGGTLRFDVGTVTLDVTSDAGYRGGEGNELWTTDFGVYNLGTWISRGPKVTPYVRVKPMGEPALILEDRWGNDVSEQRCYATPGIVRGDAVALDPFEGWRIGDTVVLCSPDGRSSLTRITRGQGSAISFADTNFSAATIERSGKVAYPYVVNLSRRAVIRAAGKGRRAHVMTMGAFDFEDVSNVEIREMGTPGKAGRYSKHYHRLGDVAGRIAPLRGLSVWHADDPGQRAIVVHQTSGLVVEECVAYNVKDHALLMEDTQREKGCVIRRNFISTLTDPEPGEKLTVNRDDRNLRDSSRKSHHYWLNSGTVDQPNVIEDNIAHGPGIAMNLLQLDARNSHTGPVNYHGIAERTIALGCSNGPWGWNHSIHTDALIVACENGTFASGNPFVGRTDIAFNRSAFLLNRVAVNNYAHFEQRFDHSTFAGNLLCTHTGGGLYKFSHCDVDVNTIYKGSNTGQTNFNGTFLGGTVYGRKNAMADLNRKQEHDSALHSPVLRFLGTSGEIKSPDGHTITMTGLGDFAQFVYRGRDRTMLNGYAWFNSICQATKADLGRAGIVWLMDYKTRESHAAGVKDWDVPRWYSVTPGDADAPEAPISDWNIGTLQDRKTITASWATSPFFRISNTHHHVNSFPYNRYGIGFVPGVYTVRVYDGDRRFIGQRTIELHGGLNGGSPTNAFLFLEDLTQAGEPTPEPEPITIVDDQSHLFRVTGSWGTHSHADAYAGQYRSYRGGSGFARARWAFLNLEPGTYQVAATWKEWTNRAKNAPFRLLDGAGREITTVRVNQQKTPDGSALGPPEVPWQVLAEIGAQGTIVVELSNDADGYVIADAVKIERVD